MVADEVRDHLPAHAQRSSVQCMSPRGVMLAVVEKPRVGETLSPTQCNTIDSSTPIWERGQVSGDASDSELRAAIRRGDLMAVSDGLFKSGFGTSAYVLSIMDSSVQRTGCNVVPGAREVQSAYRSELAGVAGILRELVQLAQGGDLGPGPVVIGLDGMKAMENSRDGVAQVGRLSFDMLDHIKALRRRLAVAVRFRWVRGHQDDGSKVLDRWVLLNVHCDTEAKRYWNKMVCKPTPKWRSEGSFTWKLYARGLKSSWAAAGIHDAVVSAAVEDYWDTKMGRVRQDSASVEAQGRRAACRRASWQQRLFVAKMSTGFIGVGAKLKQYGAEERCPWCGQVESVVHVVRCSASGQDWEACFQQYVEELETIGTSGPLVSLVYSSLRSFCGRTVRDGFQESSPVRWWPVLMGWVPHVWCEQQQQWFEEHGSGRRFYTVESWARDAVLAGWRFVHSLWRCRNQAKQRQAAVLAGLSAQREEQEEVRERESGFDGWDRCDLAVAASGAAPSPVAGADTRRAWLRFVRAVRGGSPNSAVPANDGPGDRAGGSIPSGAVELLGAAERDVLGIGHSQGSSLDTTGWAWWAIKIQDSRCRRMGRP